MNATTQPELERRRALSDQSLTQRVLLEGKRVHVVGAGCSMAGLWLLLCDYADSRGHYLYHPAERYLVHWDIVAQVLRTTCVFLPSQVEREACVFSAEKHFFGIRTAAGVFLRFAPMVDEATFVRLTRSCGLPEGWCAWHSGMTTAWAHAAAHYPIITQAMWQRLQTGEEPGESAAVDLPQDPIPLLEKFVVYSQAIKTLRVLPATITEANAYVRRFHRHNDPVVGAQYALSVADAGGTVHGVALLGRPIARLLDVGQQGERKRRYVEVLRVATDGTANVPSMLYGAARRLAKEVGYEKIITYTLASEPGSSLSAAGWERRAVVTGRQWDHRGRRRERRAIHALAKVRWECDLQSPRPFEIIHWPGCLDQPWKLERSL